MLMLAGILNRLNQAHYDSPQALSHNLKELRKSLGLTQEGFAERIGMKYKHYQDLEAGRKNNLQLRTLDRIANDLGIAPDALIGQIIDNNVSSGYSRPDTGRTLRAAEDAPHKQK